MSYTATLAGMHEKFLADWLAKNWSLRTQLILADILGHEVEAAIKGGCLGTLENAYRATQEFDHVSRHFVVKQPAGRCGKVVCK